MSLSVVCFKWRSPQGYRSTFRAEHVDTLRRMVARHYPDPHRFICVTDDARGIREPDVEIFQLWSDFGTLRNPSGIKNPSCYRRLRVFAKNAGKWLGERFVCLDLDCVIVGDLRPLWNRPDDFIIWKSATTGNPYNGSMFLNRSGTRSQLWETFDSMRSPQETKAAGFYGSDQAWIARCLGPNEKVWTRADGVLSFRIDFNYRALPLPTGSRVVFFHGRCDPWEAAQQRIGWVRENYK